MPIIQEKLFLVTGATGKQGGATALNLVKAGAKVRALTRNPDSNNAKSLEKLGIEVVKGDLNKIESLEYAMQGVYGVFSVTNFWESGTGKKEVIQNKNLADIAKKYGVQQFVFASISRCDDNPNLAHFDTKYECEKYIQSLGIPYTFLRAVYFMENLRPSDFSAKFHWTILSKVLKENTTLQMISTDDIGWFAGDAFINPNRYLNETIDIAGDEVTYSRLLEAYKKAFNSEPKKSRLMTFLLMNFMPEIRKMFDWYRESRFKVNIPELRTIHSGMMTIDEYFQKEKQKSRN